jgi:hypothetical protein
MAGELASDHAAYLRGRVGREPTAGELYVAHVLGPKGSATLIDAVRQSPAAKASALFPEAAEANRAIFYKSGRAASVSEVYANLTQIPGAASTPVTSDPTDGGFTEYASARRTEKLQEEQALVNLLLRGPEQSDSAGLGGLGGGTGGFFSTEMLRAFAEADKQKSA